MVNKIILQCQLNINHYPLNIILGVACVRGATAIFWVQPDNLLLINYVAGCPQKDIRFTPNANTEYNISIGINIIKTLHYWSRNFYAIN